MIQDYESMKYATFLKLVEVCENATDDTDRTVAVLSILTGKSVDAILNTEMVEYQRLTQAAQFIGTPPPNVPVRQEYKLGKLTLEPVLNVKHMTAGQYIDFQGFLKEDGHDFELLSCLMVPKGHKYLEDYDIEDVQKELKGHLLTRDGIALKSFFVASLVASIPALVTSSEELRKKLTREQRRKLRKATKAVGSLKNGAGSLSLMQYQRLIAAVGRPLPN